MDHCSREMVGQNPGGMMIGSVGVKTGIERGEIQSESRRRLGVD